MKLAASLFIIVLAAAASAAETGRYVVAIDRSVPLAERARTLIRDIDASPAARGRVDLGVINAFAADLSESEAAALRTRPGVRYVEPVAERHALGFVPASDSLYRNLSGQTIPPGIDVIRAREVWPVTRGEGINVAVIDTGIDYHHPDLTGAYAGGYNALEKTSFPLDDNGHGTHVAGTIAASDDQVGVVGIAPAVKVWAVKVLNSGGSGRTDVEIAGLDWVIRKKQEIGGHWVANLSFGSSASNVAEQEAIARAVDAGVVIVAASGNESTAAVPAAVGYPAAYQGVLAVGAIDASRKIASFSNQGPELGLVAPGVSVLSTITVGSGRLMAIETPEGYLNGNTLDGSGTGSVTSPYVFCGYGSAGEFPSAVRGRIALIKRGNEITFADKTRNALAAGATAVVIFNNVDDPALNFTLINPADPTALTFQWPLTVAVSKADGEALVGRGSSTTITVMNRPDDYAVLSGTSMATPHVVGAAALAWSAAPQLSPESLKLLLRSSAADLGADGFDSAYGAGLVDALNAAKSAAPQKFGQPVTPAPSTARRRGVKH